MAFMLSRPAGAIDPGSGLLLSEHFQMAYITNDIDRACELFSTRLGIKKFAQLGGQMPEGGTIRAHFAWVGTVMYELINASGPGSAIYMDRMPAGSAFRVMHHHLGFLVHDQKQWDGLMVQTKTNGWAVPYHNTNPFVEVCFVDVPELGHYLEYLKPTQAGLDFFNSVPRS